LTRQASLSSSQSWGLGLENAYEYLFVYEGVKSALETNYSDFCGRLTTQTTKAVSGSASQAKIKVVQYLKPTRTPLCATKWSRKGIKAKPIKKAYVPTESLGTSAIIPTKDRRYVKAIILFVVMDFIVQSILNRFSN